MFVILPFEGFYLAKSRQFDISHLARAKSVLYIMCLILTWSV